MEEREGEERKEERKERWDPGTLNNLSCFVGIERRMGVDKVTGARDGAWFADRSNIPHA